MNEKVKPLEKMGSIGVYHVADIENLEKEVERLREENKRLRCCGNCRHFNASVGNFAKALDHCRYCGIGDPTVPEVARQDNWQPKHHE